MTDGNFDRALTEVPPVLALFGNESTLVAEAVTRVRQRVLTRAADFNRNDFRAGETAVERVLEAAGTMPMMAPRRFVHLADVHRLPAKDQPLLIAYLDKPVPSTVLVLSGDKLDGRTKLGQALNKSGALFTFSAPSQRELAAFVAQRAKRLDTEIESEAAHLLADLVGGEIGSIDRALEKLALYRGDGASLTTEDVELLVAPTRVHSIFELTDAIGVRDLGKASLLLRNALAGGESALPILAMITRQLRQLIQVTAARARGATARDVVQELGIKPFLADQLLAQARRYNEGELYAALDAALRADIRVKSTRLEPGVILDRLLVEIMATPHA